MNLQDRVRAARTRSSPHQEVLPSRLNLEDPEFIFTKGCGTTSLCCGRVHGATVTWAPSAEVLWVVMTLADALSRSPRPKNPDDRAAGLLLPTRTRPVALIRKI